jgi:hypothetical protein
VVRLSAFCAGRELYSPTNILGTHFCYNLIQPKGNSEAGTITQIKKSSYLLRI